MGRSGGGTQGDRQHWITRYHSSTAAATKKGKCGGVFHCSPLRWWLRRREIGSTLCTTGRPVTPTWQSRRAPVRRRSTSGSTAFPELGHLAIVAFFVATKERRGPWRRRLLRKTRSEATRCSAWRRSQRRGRQLCRSTQRRVRRQRCRRGSETGGRSVRANRS